MGLELILMSSKVSTKLHLPYDEGSIGGSMAAEASMDDTSTLHNGLVFGGAQPPPLSGQLKIIVDVDQN